MNPPRNGLWWSWVMLLVLLALGGVIASWVPTQDCLRCRLHQQKTGRVEITFVLTTGGCYGVGWEGCPDCRGREEVPLFTYLRRRMSQP